MKTKTTLYGASEALKILSGYADVRFPKETGSTISKKIFDNSDPLTKNTEFLGKETQKIIDEYHAVSSDPENPDSQLVVKDEEGEIDLEKTSKFLEEVISLRNSEVDIEIPSPFTESEVRDYIPLTAREYGFFRFMIDPDDEPEFEVVELG